jgi:hypothetical protein
VVANTLRIRYNSRMTDPQNLILRHLQEFRAEAAARGEKTQAQIGTLAQGLNGVRTELQAIRASLAEMAIAIDHHTTRLDRIEKHLGCDAAKH